MNKRMTELIDLLKENNTEYKVLTPSLGIPCITWEGKVCQWAAIYDSEEDKFALAVYKDYLTADQVIKATLG